VLNICTWLWGNSKYTNIYVERLYAGVQRHLHQPFRFLLMTERWRDITLRSEIERHAIKDEVLTKILGCFARLRMFDVGWQINRKLHGPIICLDLDIVITGTLDHLFNRSEPIVLLEGANSLNPCPYNNSVFMFQPGAHPELWSDFSMDVAKKIRYQEFPDDQGWFWHKLPNAATWKVGPSSGIWSFRKRNWPPGDALPSQASIVAFPGHRDPSQFTHLKWVKEHWINVS
jgi:hypothetical protein